ncbi:MAG: hypothetical protein VX614_09250 [Myxococcota bacterium]|nr:hypothetical protein [Myxococcota bacterium]
MKRFIAGAMVIPFLSRTGCSLAVPSRQSINIIPSAQQAKVYVDGNYVGDGPQTVSMSKSTEHSIMAKCGSSAGTAVVSRSMSTTGILDAIGGFILLVPWIGLVSPGAWKLTPTSVSVGIPDESGCK